MGGTYQVITTLIDNGVEPMSTVTEEKLKQDEKKEGDTNIDTGPKKKTENTPLIPTLTRGITQVRSQTRIIMKPKTAQNPKQNKQDK